MSATSGIGISPELSSAFASAASSQSIRFIKVSIRNETLVSDATINASGSVESDFGKIDGFLEEKEPAYVLVRLDDPPTEWIAIHYVPDSAPVRDKMLYASTRNSLTKGLGSNLFTDTIFATSKDDLTPAAYAAHKRHVAAPQPMSAREKEMAEVKAAERQSTTYEGSRARQNHIGTPIGIQWPQNVQDAVKDMTSLSQDRLIVLNTDATAENLVLTKDVQCGPDELGANIPSSEPCYAFYAFSKLSKIVFIYSCPSGSPVKHRMIYSSGSQPLYQYAKQFIPAEILATRKIETSDPSELNEAYLQFELTPTSVDQARSGTSTPGAPPPSDAAKSFARPKGPPRRR